VRVYPALRITFFESPSEEQMDLLLALLDDFRPTAINDIENGLIAYFGRASVRDNALAHLGAYELVDALAEEVPDENWAERSQAALTPVTVGRHPLNDLKFDPDADRASEVEVTFTALAGRRTRVDLEHRRFDRHGPDGDGLRRAVDAPDGWGYVVGRYQRAVRAEGDR